MPAAGEVRPGQDNEYRLDLLLVCQIFASKPTVRGINIRIFRPPKGGFFI